MRNLDPWTDDFDSLVSMAIAFRAIAGRSRWIAFKTAALTRYPILNDPRYRHGSVPAEELPLRSPANVLSQQVRLAIVRGMKSGDHGEDAIALAMQLGNKLTTVEGSTEIVCHLTPIVMAVEAAENF